MSEKRFELVNGIITDMQDNERMYGIFELVDKLNELSEENEQLKKENKELRIKYMYRGLAITEAVEDLYKTEEVYLAGFNICKRIIEYEREFNE